jgi:hypothetical protein
VWKNPLTGYGTGIAHLVSVRGQSGQAVVNQVAVSEASRSAANAVPHTGS